MPSESVLLSTRRIRPTRKSEACGCPRPGERMHAAPRKGARGLGKASALGVEWSGLNATAKEIKDAK